MGARDGGSGNCRPERPRSLERKFTFGAKLGIGATAIGGVGSSRQPSKPLTWNAQAKEPGRILSVHFPLITNRGPEDYAGVDDDDCCSRAVPRVHVA